MEKLPPEILSKIVSNLIEETCFDLDISENIPQTPLAAYAPISLQWKNAVEAITFRYLRLTPERIAEAEAAQYFSPARLAHISGVWFDFRPCKGVDIQQHFNSTTNTLFCILKRLPACLNPTVHFFFRMSHPDDYLPPTEESETKTTTYLELSPDWDSNLTDIPAISLFRVDGLSFGLAPVPSSVNIMASKMTRLKHIEWWLSDAEKKNSDLRIRHRTEFANTLEKLPMSLKAFKLEYNRRPPRNRSFQPASIIPSDAPGDILSRALSRLTQRDGFGHFELHASVDSSILWSHDHDLTSAPCWPTLQSFGIILHDVLPSGDWIDIRDPDDGASSSGSEDGEFDTEVPGEEYAKRFASINNQAVMDSFALAAAKAASRMPNISSLEISHFSFSQMRIDLHPLRPPYLEFAGYPHDPEPSNEVLDAWRGTFKEHGLNWDFKITKTM